MSREPGWSTSISIRLAEEEPPERQRRPDRVSTRWEREVDPDGVLGDRERRKKADAAMKKFMREMRSKKPPATGRQKPKVYKPRPTQTDKLRELRADMKKAKRLSQYGLSLEDFERMLAEQAGLCALCGGAPNAGKGLCVDHCHRTGRVRGLLCQRCNTLLGGYEAMASIPGLGDYLRPNPGQD